MVYKFFDNNTGSGGSVNGQLVEELHKPVNQLETSKLVNQQKKWTFIINKELSNNYFTINKISNKFLLTGDQFMPELHLKQPGFTYCTWESFTKHRERI